MLYPNIVVSENPDKLVVPLFFFNESNKQWYAAFTLENDWLIEPQIVFIPLDELVRLLSQPKDEWDFKEIDTMSITLEEYLSEVNNAAQR